MDLEQLNSSGIGRGTQAGLRSGAEIHSEWRIVAARSKAAAMAAATAADWGPYEHNI